MIKSSYKRKSSVKIKIKMLNIYLINIIYVYYSVLHLQISKVHRIKVIKGRTFQTMWPFLV